MLRCCTLIILGMEIVVDCIFSARFVREFTDVSYVAGDGVELTAHDKSVVVEEIKEVELRSR